MGKRLDPSPYLLRLSADARPRHCYYCGNQFDDQSRCFPYIRTRDHILARTHGRVHHFVARNHRPACMRCNGLRAVLGHCCGALMLAIIEAGHREFDCSDMALKLGMRPASMGRKSARKIERTRRGFNRIVTEVAHA